MCGEPKGEVCSVVAASIRGSGSEWPYVVGWGLGGERMERSMGDPPLVCLSVLDVTRSLPVESRG
jgi:hypothetical protein